MRCFFPIYFIYDTTTFNNSILYFIVVHLTLVIYLFGIQLYQGVNSDKSKLDLAMMR